MSSSRAKGLMEVYQQYVERTRDSNNQYTVPVTSAVRRNTYRKHSITTVTLQTGKNLYWNYYTALHLFGESTQSYISSKYKSTHKRLRTKEYTELGAIQTQTEVHKIMKLCTKDNFCERAGLQRKGSRRNNKKIAQNNAVQNWVEQRCTELGRTTLYIIGYNNAVQNWV